MQEIKCPFEIELDKLLKQYLEDDDLNRINQQINAFAKGMDKTSEMINDFYKNQLDVKITNHSERFKIDRTITFSEKKLNPHEFTKFLIELGQVCLSGGRLNLAAEIFRKAEKSSTDDLNKADSLLGLADIFSRKAEWSSSFKVINEAEELYKEQNNNMGLAKCDNLLGSIYGERGELEKAKKHFLSSLSKITLENDLEMSATLETNLAVIESLQGNSEKSIPRLRNALSSYIKLDNRKRISELYHNIGLIYLELEEYESALAAFDEGIEICKYGRFLSVLSLILLAKSQVLIAMNEISEASEFADKALEISEQVDDKLTRADIFKVKGTIARYLKNYKEAESFLLTSLRINIGLENEMNIAETSYEIAMLKDEMKNFKSKDSYLLASLNYFKQVNAFEKVKKIENMMGYQIV
jgi:tetratricopeptide (TPR) repeat protein